MRITFERFYWTQEIDLPRYDPVMKKDFRIFVNDKCDFGKIKYKFILHKEEFKIICSYEKEFEVEVEQPEKLVAILESNNINSISFVSNLKHRFSLYIKTYLKNLYHEATFDVDDEIKE
ncbi:MAG: hypothetical protein SGI96_18445 [Bacteroidota bacterium]|nr:hypothetical protein [Bacteroidota bacterium]